ncbi:MAG: hypothetical protein AABW67_03890 [Nanoarchaeota archaeon]
MSKKTKKDVEILLNGEKVTLPSEEEMNKFRGQEGFPPIEESLHIGLLQMEEKDD